MKKCDECGDRVAHIHVTHIVEGKLSVRHFCEECARKKGISVSIAGENIVTPCAAKEPSSVEGGETDMVCSNCGMTFSSFRNQGWLGCSHCYDAFEKEIDNLLLQVHGANVHKGKRYKYAELDKRGDIRRLRGQLRIAIKQEEFELAAVLRDMIKSRSGGSAEESVEKNEGNKGNNL